MSRWFLREQAPEAAAELDGISQREVAPEAVCGDCGSDSCNLNAAEHAAVANATFYPNPNL